MSPVPLRWHPPGVDRSLRLAILALGVTVLAMLAVDQKNDEADALYDRWVEIQERRLRDLATSTTASTSTSTPTATSSSSSTSTTSTTSTPPGG